MNCPLLNGKPELIVDLCADRLPVPEARELEAHIAACEICRREYKAQERLWNELDLWEPEPVSLQFNREILKKLDQSEASSRSSWWSWATDAYGPAAPLAAAGFTALLALMISLAPSTNRVPHSAPGTRVERIDVDQLERALDDMALLRTLQVSEARGKASPSL